MFLKTLRPLLVATVVTAAPVAAWAQAYNETGDAGETIATAQVVSGSVTQINGVLQNLGSLEAPIDDIDLYRITILNPAAFGVTVSSSLLEPDIQHFLEDDTQLYLFNGAGQLLSFSDDSQVSDGSYPFGNPIFRVGDFASLAAGDYYLGFDLFFTRPIDANGFPLGTDLSLGWRRLPSPFEAGPYTLFLTGTSTGNGGPVLPDVPGIPEPSTWAMLILGLGGAGAMLRRRRAVFA